MSDDLNTRGLDKLLKALKDQKLTARVGILGTKAARSGGQGAATNAEIGAHHEFGTSRLPVRSFLRLPISSLLGKELEKSGAFTKDAMNEVVAQASLKPWLEKVAIVAETIVLGAFDSGGYGTWPPSDMTHKKVHQTLVETHQLRDSITWDVQGG